jgi:hypothetical protein
MAEIRIERKRRGLGWLWLLLALLIVAALAWYFLYPGRNATPPPATGAPPATGSLERGLPGGYELSSQGAYARAPSVTS